MCNNCKRCCKTCGNLDKGHCKCQPCQYVEKVKEDLVELADEVNKLEQKSSDAYNKHPNDIMDLGENQAYKICLKKINGLLKKIGIVK